MALENSEYIVLGFLFLSISLPPMPAEIEDDQ